MTPALVDGVTPAMRLFHEEQFGPVVPIARYRDIAEVTDALKTSWSGQQVIPFPACAAARVHPASMARLSAATGHDSATRARPCDAQAAVFTTDASAASPVIDALSTIVGRININAQVITAMRSPWDRHAITP